jgi:hypothetical protein
MSEPVLDAALESSDEEAPPAQKPLFQLGIFSRSDDPVAYDESEQRLQASARKSIETVKARASTKAECSKKGNAARQKRFRDNSNLAAARRGEQPKQRGRPRVPRSPEAAENSGAEGSGDERGNEPTNHTYKV